MQYNCCVRASAIAIVGVAAHDRNRNAEVTGGRVTDVYVCESVSRSGHTISSYEPNLPDASDATAT